MAQSSEQGDDGLRSKIRCALGYCEANQHECIFESSRNESQELDLIMQLILADRKQHELDARKDQIMRDFLKHSLCTEVDEALLIEIRDSQLKQLEES